MPRKFAIRTEQLPRAGAADSCVIFLYTPQWAGWRDNLFKESKNLQGKGNYKLCLNFD